MSCARSVQVENHISCNIIIAECTMHSCSHFGWCNHDGASSCVRLACRFGCCCPSTCTPPYTYLRTFEPTSVTNSSRCTCGFIISSILGPQLQRWRAHGSLKSMPPSSPSTTDIPVLLVLLLSVGDRLSFLALMSVSTAPPLQLLQHTATVRASIERAIARPPVSLEARAT